MENLDLIAIIQKHSLTVRCLPHKVITYWTYQEGDENKTCVDSNGKPCTIKRSLFIREDGKKLLKRERDVQNGGWWYVKETQNTDSTVRFNRKYDKFFAPTLEEAIKIYLESIK